jgi:O-methyltransferase
MSSNDTAPIVAPDRDGRASDAPSTPRTDGLDGVRAPKGVRPDASPAEPGQPLGGRLIAWVVQLAEALRLRWAISRLVRGLPPSLRRRVVALQVRVGYLRGIVLVPEADLDRSYEAALRLLGHDLDDPAATYLEFGVYVGTSIGCMYRAASRVGVERLRLIGFDSFQGMPEVVAGEEDQRWSAGGLYSDLESTKRNLARLKVPLDQVELVPGWFEESLTEHTRRRLGLERATVVMVDSVISSSAAAALEFCAPLIVDRTIVYFDDWATNDFADRGLGERAAFESWLEDHPDMNAEELPSLAYRNARAFMVTRTPSAQGQAASSREA